MFHNTDASPLEYKRTEGSVIETKNHLRCSYCHCERIYWLFAYIVQLHSVTFYSVVARIVDLVA
jgi:hypothetical protein